MTTQSPQPLSYDATNTSNKSHLGPEEQAKQPTQTYLSSTQCKVLTLYYFMVNSSPMTWTRLIQDLWSWLQCQIYFYQNKKANLQAAHYFMTTIFRLDERMRVGVPLQVDMALQDKFMTFDATVSST